jgi:DNA-binding PadR family transcriptional regulator
LSEEIMATIIRILKDEEYSGYSIYKMLAAKGVKTWPNHVYTLLVRMEKELGLLKSRWVGGGADKRREKTDAPRRHLYALSEAGAAEYDNIVRDSLGVLMERFFRENLSLEDLSFHIGLARETLGVPPMWERGGSFRLVIASPSYHPLVCFPKFYYAVSEAYPNASVYVVKTPWENALRPLEARKNLTFVEGSRDDIPLRDGFADFVILQGFPNSSSVRATIGECLRVLKEDGYLFLEIPSILTAEKGMSHTTVFPEYVLKLFYELCGQDRTARIEEVRKALSACFAHTKSVEIRGKVIFQAAGKFRAKNGNQKPLPIEVYATRRRAVSRPKPRG